MLQTLTTEDEMNILSPHCRLGKSNHTELQSDHGLCDGSGTKILQQKIRRFHDPPEKPFFHDFASYIDDFSSAEGPIGSRHHSLDGHDSNSIHACPLTRIITWMRGEKGL